MKKILALVLALVMTMSLATISSGAAYSDADKVQYVDAVDTMSALGVLGGYADGSIRPQADVTRGAAAKMVAMVATGSNATTIGYYKGTSTFADVPAGHTFADAVAFCVARGIVAGYGDGNYGVADNVKGWAVAKMVLVAMGYDAKAFGMEGAGSALNTITLATQKGLFAGLNADFDANAAASREECAQIVYNALNKSTVVKGFVNSDGSYTYSESSAKLADNYSAIKTAIVVGNTATGEAYTKLSDGTYLTNETGLDMVGHLVNYVDTKAPVTKDTFAAKTAFAVVDKSTVVTVAAAEGIDTKKEFVAKFGAETVAKVGSFASFTNYNLDAVDANPITGFVPAAGTYVLNSDGALVAYLTGTTSVGYVSDYSAGTTAADGFIKVSVGGSVTSYALETSNASIAAKEYTMVSYYAGLAKGDIVLVNATGSLTTLSKAATVEGVVSAVDSAAGYETITIGGAVYYKSANYTEVASNVMATGSVLTWTGAMTKTVVAYVDASNGIIALTEKAGETTDAGLVYVVAPYTVAGAVDAYGASATSTYFAQCVDTNGKEVSYQVAALSDVPAAGLYKATMAYNATLKTNVATFSAADDVAGNWKIESGAVNTTTSALKVAGTSDYYASDVKTIYVSGTLSELKVSVLAGAQTAASAAYYAVKNGSNFDVKYLFVAGTPSTVVASTDVVYVSAAAATSTKVATYVDANGQTLPCKVYTVYVNGVAKEVKSLDASLNVGFNSYSIDSATGLYAFADYTTNVKESIVATGLYGNLLTVGTLADVDASAAKVVDVRYAEAWDKTDLVEITSIAGLLADGSLTDTGATVSVVYTVDAYGAANAITTIYVEAAPSMSAGSSTTGGSTSGANPT